VRIGLKATGLPSDEETVIRGGPFYRRRGDRARRTARLVACAAIALVAAVVPASASAAGKQLWTSDALNSVANDVAGTTDMTVWSEDDPTEWAGFFPPGTDSENVLGFVALEYPPLYHEIFLDPYVYSTFGSWFSTGTPQGNEFAFSVAALSLIHESFHWRLLSGDESTVNACALKYFPYYVAKDFGVPETVTQTTTEVVPVTTTKSVPVVHLKVVKRRVKVHGKWVLRTKRTKFTTYTIETTTSYESRPVTSTVANPLFQTLVADAASFYTQQPPPYNAGTCTV
jgi:hypothetical protein